MDGKLYSFVPLMRAAEISSLRGRSAAIGAFNVNFYAQAEGILKGLEKAESPGIIQASKGANKFNGGADKIQEMVLIAIKNRNFNLPVSLHLDHGDKESAKECVDRGFSSVMIDASILPVAENISVSKMIAEYAHKFGVGVEAEYGLLSGIEEDIEHQKTIYSDSRFVPVFLSRSNVDALAIAYGTSHGPNKGKTEALNIGIVRESYDGLKAFKMNIDNFLVSHGSSTVPNELVEEVNRYGGRLSDTNGVPEYKLIEAIESGIRKINIDTDLRLGITATVRKYFYENPEVSKKSEALRLVEEIMNGKKTVKDKDGSVIDYKGIIDPRTYLQPLMDKFPDILRCDYRKYPDTDYIHLMDLIKDRVATHVEKLCHLFNCAGLAGKVERD
jgi:fructose-bisphosphate aldolase, class II